MLTLKNVAIAVSAIALVAGAPLMAKAPVKHAAAAPVRAAPVALTMDQAEKLRKLDIMLMVTSLRCRNTSDNFQPDFQRFEAAHLTTLNSASSKMRQSLVSRYGEAGANKALDRLSTGMANQYGQGHPWLGCGELKTATRSLAAMKGTPPLYEAADQLLAERGSGSQLAWARK
jgi:hypothetical protein